MGNFSQKTIFATLELKIQDGRHNLRNLKMLQIKKFFFQFVENLILRNITMRQFSLKPIFWAPGTKIQDGRHNLRNLKMVQIQKFLF